MTRFTKSAARRGLSALGLALSFGLAMSLSQEAVADERCVFNEQAGDGQNLAFDDYQQIKGLIANFFFELYDGPLTDQQIHDNVQALFTPDLTFVVCSGGGNNFLFSATDTASLATEISKNYDYLKQQGIKAIHVISEPAITRIDATTVQEEGSLLLMLQTSDSVHGPQPEYTAAIRGTLKKVDGTWRFQKRYFIIDNPSIVAYAR